jgi:diguanylate cyclase (GGDEF)-like protein
MSELSASRLLAIIGAQEAIASASLELEEVMDLVVSHAQQITGAAAGVVELIEGEEMVYHAVSGTAKPFAGVRLAVATSLSGRCLLEEAILHCEDAEGDPRVDREAALRVGARSMLCVPLTYGKRAVGVLKVYDPRPYAFGEDDVITLQLLSRLFGAAMAHADDFELQRYASQHDALTGLPNRRAFEEQLTREIARVNRHGGELTVCLADLDAFKAVNDRQGHAMGDSVLRAVAGILKRLRGTDQAFRFGGDEFAVIFSGADLEGARTAMRRTQAAIESEPACRRVGLSWGLAQFSQEDAETFLARADTELYAVKRVRRRAPVHSRA